jgi:hypothetical protein
MKKKIQIGFAALALAACALAAGAGEQARSIVGNGYGVILDDRDRCVFAFSDAALPDNVASFCQNGALLYRTDSSTMYSKVSGTFSTWNPVLSVDRSSLVENALQAHPATLLSNTGQALTATETAGTFDITIGTNTIALNGEVTDNETETSIGYFPFILPPSYVAAGDVSVVFNSALIKTGSPTNNASSLDLSCYEQASVAVGDDLVSSNAATYAALDTYYAKTFSLTATTLVAGDILLCKVTTAIVDSEAGAGTITWTSDPIKVLLDVKG